MDFYPGERVALFIDGANLYSAARALQFDIDYKKLFIWYKEEVQPQKIISNKIEIISAKRVAFMCVELDPMSCHRHCISVALEEKGYLIYDL